MKVFLKWTLSAFAFLAIIIFIKISAKEKFDFSYLGIFLSIVAIGAIVLGSLFTLIELKYLPWRKKRLMKKLIRVFDGERISDTVAHFKYGDFDCYAEIEITLNMSQYGNYEMIRFHIPRQQVDNSPIKSSFNLSKSVCNGGETYNIYVGSPYWLNLAKRRLEKKIGRKII